MDGTPEMRVITPKSSIWMGCSLRNLPSYWGTHMETPTWKIKFGNSFGEDIDQQETP